MSLNIVNSFKTSIAGAAGWKELARTTLGSANATINVPSIADKRYYMILQDSNGTTGGTGAATMQFNADTASNYSRRDSQNGGADTTAINASSISTFGTGTSEMFQVGYMANLSAKEKLIQWFLVHAGDGGAASFSPFRQEGVGKWVNTSEPFDEFDWNTGGSTFLTGSEVVVLGWDPADTHADNFWEELGTVTQGAAVSTLDVSFTAKKYLWIQMYWTNTSAGNGVFRVGNTTIDTGANYSDRRSANGAADSTDINLTFIQGINGNGQANVPRLTNVFIVNNASNEKLMIFHTVDLNSVGAANAPNRNEVVAKWTNTSNQIDIVQLLTQTGNIGSDSIIKVWGSD